MTTERKPSEIDVIAERWVDTLAVLDPAYNVWLGRESDDDSFADYSPTGQNSFLAAAGTVLRELESAVPLDDIDRVTRNDLRASLALNVQLSEAGWNARDINVIASPAQDIRNTFDLMSTESENDWEHIARRLRAVPEALRGYREALREGVRNGNPPARRQVTEVAEAVLAYDGPDGFFASLAQKATEAVSITLREELEGAALEAGAAYSSLSNFLRETIAPAARTEDGVGRELYGLLSEEFLGLSVDLDETYEWGLDELNRMVSEQERIADQIAPGQGVAGAVAALDADPRYQLQGSQALASWMQELSDQAVEELGREHFDIPAEIRRLECLIAPTHEGGIYYTSPSDDFARPGRMWWSVPPGVEVFNTWREKTTVYHEGVPGHHLQIGQAVVNRGELNTYRRQLAGTSGHAEGWALYAERLMEELGYLQDPADRLGMLDGQRMRAARVVLDIGVHLCKPTPEGEGSWNAEYAFEFMSRHVNMDPAFVRFEVLRYLGWPGQAPSYKIGQRIWQGLRDEAEPVMGLRSFHQRALALGGVRLDTLVEAFRIR